MKKNCVIIGCGWLGQPLGNEIAKLGFTVYGGTRNAEKINVLSQQGINGFKIDFNEQEISLALSSEQIQDTSLLIFSIPPTGFSDYGKSLLEIARIFPEETHLIFTSSTRVYKEVTEFVNENSALNENHAVTQAEILLQNNFKERLTILRLAGLIGENRHPVKYFLNKKDIPNGLAPVNLIQLKDVIQAFLSAIQEKKVNQIYNVCSPQHPSRMDYYGEIAIQKFGAQLSFLIEGNVKIIDGSKIVKESGFQYNTSIFEV
jgi:nucleoside-diphosphate-sugar epimerase